MIATIFSRWMKKTFPKARGRATARRTMPAAKPKPGFKPGVEQFEDRVVPATLTVSVSSGTGAGSLPYELSQANSGDRIVFQEGTNDISISATLDITVSDLTIDGSAFGPVTIDGGHGSLVFSVANDVTGVTLNDLIVQNGTSADGGGLYLNPGSSVTVNTSTFSNDDGNVFGGGIVNNQGILTVTNSTFVADTGVAGGAIDNAGTAYITNSTFSGNTANSSGGGIYNAGTITITDSTFSQNVATANGTQGGAIYTGLDSTTILNGDILVGNSDGLGADDVAGQASVSGSDNLVGTISVPGLSVGNGNQLGVTVAQAGLTPLGWYGGPTETYALLPSSSAIGTGYSGSTSTDQRGLARPSPSDAGAFQLDPLVVNTDVDTYGPVAFGSLSLRNAINEVDVDTDTGVSEPITFSTLPATSTTTDFTTAQTIDLSAGTLVLGDGVTPIASITIAGPVAGLTLSGTDEYSSSVFSVQPGVKASITGAVTGAITITGAESSIGAGILNAGDLSLDYVNFSDNEASAAGAAFYNSGGTATISNADINGNNSNVNGGGVYVYSGKVTVNYATATDNTAYWGGAFYGWFGTLDIKNSTISGNTAYISGGGLYESYATMTVTGSTFASNTVTGGAGGGAIGIGVFAGGFSEPLLIVNSTFYANQAEGVNGGAIWNSGGDITAVYDTFTQNSTTGSGGGIYSSGGSTLVVDSILVGNTGSGGPDDLSGTSVNATSSYNVVGTDNTTSISLANNNQLNVTVAEAALAPLGWYGGPTETVALMPGSLAIGTGTVDSLSSVDQRGVTRPTCSPDPDVGAYQTQSVGGQTSVIVNVTWDAQLGYGPNDQGPSPLGDITLRDAVNIVDNDTTTTEPIAFDPTVFEFEQVITLDSTAGTLILGPGPIAPVYIQGPQNEDDGIVISGGGKVTVFKVDQGVKAEISGSSSGQFQISGGAGTNGGGLAVSSGSVSARYIGFYDDTAANGGGIYNHGGSIEIHYGDFIGNSATNDGGAIYNDGPAATGTVVLGNSTNFYSNSATDDGGAIYSQGDLTLYSNSQNSSYYESNSAANGGAIYSNGTLTLHAYGYGDTAIDFQDNTATGAGGAIYSIGLLEIYGQGSENAAVYFSGNRAGTDGGAIYNSGSTSGSITDAAFENNRAASGGGIYTGGAELNVYDAYFYENYATNGNGGGIYSDAYLYVDDVGFTTNVAVNGNGGGIYAADGSGSINAEFGGNLAIDGGGLFIGGGGTMNIGNIGGQFIDNQASGNGGAIASEGAGEVSICVSATGNNADLNGGAIYNTNSSNTVQLIQSDIVGNKAAGDGGGLYNSGTIAVQHGGFEGNKAANGGGAFNSGTMHVTDADFSENTAASSGAGVYNSGNFSATGTSRSSVEFSGNSAHANGGGLYTTGNGQVYVSGSTFLNNSALNNGGGIYDANTNSITLANVTFILNEASVDGGGIYAATGTLTVDPSTFYKNSAENGGAVYVAAGANVTLASDTFTGNHVANEGGAIFNASSVTVDDGKFTCNSAGSNGGGIFNSSGASAIVSASTFSKNIAKNGGGIYNGSGSVSVYGGTTFSNNVASNDGGGIYNAAGLTINSSTSFTGNTATENGGGLYDNSASVIISGTGAIDFTDNTATNGSGGGLYVVGALLGDNVFDFQGNTAGNDGGGMYIQTYNSYTIANSTFTGNSAEHGGGLFNQTAGTELRLLLSQFEGNTAFAGGAVFNSAGSMAVISCQIGGTGVGQGNTALFGGGLYTTEGTVRITATTFTDNNAKTTAPTPESHTGGYGGGIYAVGGGGLYINASTFNRNTAKWGGGLVNGKYTFSSITNATFYENSAGSEGGGIYNSTSDAGLSATDNTLFKNTAGTAGGGLYTLGSTVLNGDLIVGNTANSVADDVSGNPNDINVPESNDNLVGVDNTAELKFNVNNQVGVSVAQAGVQPLAYNGFMLGTVQLETCALSVGSYALGKGLVPGQVYSVNPAPTTDARGVERPGGGYISGLMPENGDVGAFQFSNPPQVTVQPPASTTIYLPQGTPSDTTTVSTSFYANVTDIYNDYTYPSTNDTTSVPSSVQWQFSTNNGVTWSNVNAGGLYGNTPTTTTLVINESGTATQQQLDELSGDLFRAVFTNTASETTTTDSASLTVDYSPFVTTNPSPASIVEGDTATFTASAIGNPAPTVQWWYEAPGGSSFTALTDGSLGGEASISGSATTTLSVATDPNLGYNLNGYQFEAVFTNSYNSETFTVTTNPATLNVTYEPVGIVNPTSVTVDAGNSATFTTTYSSANPTASVTWLVSTDNGSTYSPVSGGDYTVAPGVNSSTLTINSAAASMNGYWYEAQYTNSVGTVTTTAAQLTVDYEPTVTVQPTSVTIVDGNTTTFTATATGNPAPVVMWEVSTDGGNTWNPVSGSEYGESCSTTGLTTTGTLTITDAPASLNLDEYEAVFSNTLSGVSPPVVTTVASAAATLTVNYPPSVTLSPTDATVNAGPSNTVTFTADYTTGYNSAFSSDPGSTTVQWLVSVNGGSSFSLVVGSIYTVTSGADSSSSSIVAGSVYTVTSGTDSSTLTITGPTSDMNGYEYEAVFSNGISPNATTVPAVLTVDYAPIVTTNPVNVTVYVGNTASFSAAASGNPAPTVQWEVSTDGGNTYNPLTDGTVDGVTYSGSATDTLTISDTTTALNGYYYEAVFSNTLYQASSPSTATSSAAELTVDESPIIITQPISTTFDVGGSTTTATFTAAATGSPTLPTAQWYVSDNGGASFSMVVGSIYSVSTVNGSSTLTITSPTADMNGYEYEAIFSNGVAPNATTSIATLTVDYAPIVTTSPSDQTVNMGGTATFTAAATGNPAPTVLWYYEAPGGNSFTALSDGSFLGGEASISGSATTTLSVTTDPNLGYLLNGYQFEAVFTNSYNSETYTATTNPATLNVTYEPQNITNPTSTTVNAGNSATFTTSDSSANLPANVTWLVSTDGGSTYSPVSGGEYQVSTTVTGLATTSTLTITSATSGMNTYLYEAEYSNSVGTVTTAAAQLTVDFEPTVTVQPTSVTIVDGNTTSFTAAATGNSVPTVLWFVSTDGGVTFNQVNGAEYSQSYTTSGLTTTAVLTITNAPATLNQYEYEAVFTNNVTGTGLGEGVDTSPATLTVNYPLTITSSPPDATVNAGASNTVTFTADYATGYNSAFSSDPGSTTVQWLVSVNGGSSFSIVVGSIYTVTSGADSSTLTITGPTSDMNGYEYEAVFSNGISPNATTVPAVLTVDYAPIVTTNPVNVTVNVGGTASFSAAASGNPAPTVQWEVSTDGGNTYNPLTDGTVDGVTYSGSATDTLTITGTTTSLNGDQYEAVFTNTLSGESTPSSATTSAASLTVDESPIITTQPISTTFDVGGTPTTATFTAAATGSPTQPNVQWYVSDNGGASFSIISDGTLYSGSATDTLTITGPDSTMNGYEYEAVFSNGIAPPATTSAATLTVDYGPAITTQPTSQTVIAGGTATFSAVASGNPVPTVQWYSEAPGASSFTPITGATSTTLTVSNASFAMDGTQYEAVFSNTLSGESTPSTATTNVVTLTVDDAPTVTTDPASASILVGTNTSFSAAATGNPAPTVTWEVSTDGGVTFAPFATTGSIYSVNTVVSGQNTTTALNITGATVGMNGYEYEAVFSNGVTPNATTTTATLSVGTAPAITTQPTNVIQSVGSTATFTAAASGSPTPTVQWYSEAPGATSFTPITGATSTTLTVSNITAAMNGTQYEAVFTNTYGTATTNTATLNTLGLVLTAGPDVLVYSTSGALVDTLTPFGTSVSSVQAQIGEVLGDGQEDLVVAAEGKVEVFHGIIGSMAESFQPYGTTYTSGLNIAVGNVLSSNPTSVDIVVAPQTSGQKVDIFNGAGVFQASFSPFAATYPHQKYSGGLSLAVGHYLNTQVEYIAVGTQAPQSALVQVWGYYDDNMILFTKNYSFIGKGVYLSSIPGNNGRDDLVVGTDSIGTSRTAHLYVVNIKTGVTVISDKVYGALDQQEVRVGELMPTGSGTPEIVVATGAGATQQVLTYTFDSTTKSMTLAETYTATELDLDSVAAGYNGGIYVG